MFISVSQRQSLRSFDLYLSSSNELKHPMLLSPHSNDCWPGLFPSHLREHLFVIVIDMWVMRQWESTLFIPEKWIACIKVSRRTNLLLLFSWSPGWRRGKGSKRRIEKFYCIMWALSLIYRGSEPHGTNYRSELGITFNKNKNSEI